MSPPASEPLLTVGAAARAIGVSAATLRRYDRAGLLVARRDPANGYRVYSTVDVERFVLARRDPHGRAQEVVARLRPVYGSPRLGNPTGDPVDVLFYTLLSLRTTDRVLSRVWAELSSAYRPWGSLLTADDAALARTLAPAGFSVTRARHFKQIAAIARDSYGGVTLEPLHRMDDEAAERALRSLPGVGQKTARCVMLFALHRDVVPVDVHVHRVCDRLGLIDARPDSPAAHRAVDEAVPAGLAYHFHTNVVAHGRAACRPRVPRCSDCVLADLCDHARSHP